MQRSILLASKPKQLTFHRYKNVKLVQRKEDKNTIIQGEHCIIVLEEMESFIWDRCTGENSVLDIVNMVLALEDYKANPFDEIASIITHFLNELQEQALIEICED